ncbi:hypothetical protein ACYULU_10530 [Breznakiellaceae bacterium SP9]
MNSGTCLAHATQAAKSFLGIGFETQSLKVRENFMAMGLLGPAGGIIAVVGVNLSNHVRDTAFRSACLTVADWGGVNQNTTPERILLSLPRIGTGALMTQIDFNIVWRYFS